MTDAAIWNRYWHYDRIASCFDGAGASNYDDSVAAGWRAFFAGLPAGARILDLCTGNGAAALIAAEVGRRQAKGFAIHAVDRADIDPLAYVTRHGDLYARIAFRGGVEVEALPFADASFDAAISQYGVEYSDLARSVPELLRVLAPGGRIRLVVHAAEGVVAAGAREMIADADMLLDKIDLPGAAARCFEAVTAVERAGGDKPAADRAFAAFQSALERTADYVPLASDSLMVRNSGAVLLDTFSRRAAFDVDQLLAKAGEVRTEIAAHRGRLTALIEAALDQTGAEALAARLGGRCTALTSAQGLIGYEAEARLPD